MEPQQGIDAVDRTVSPMLGHVVNVSSIQGKEGIPRCAAYSAAKAGSIALTKTAARDASA